MPYCTRTSYNVAYRDYQDRLSSALLGHVQLWARGANLFYKICFQAIDFLPLFCDCTVASLS